MQSFSLVRFHAFTEQKLEKEGVVSFWILLLIYLLRLPAAEVGLMQYLRLEGSKVARHLKEGRNVRNAGQVILTSVGRRLTQCGAFLCQDTEAVGGREVVGFRLHSHTYFMDLSVATRLHTALVIVADST